VRWLAFMLGRRLAVLLALAAAGCSTQPRYERPPVELPQAWKESAPPYVEDGRWWRIYQDGELDKLVDEALAQNSDLRLAARVIWHLVRDFAVGEVIEVAADD